MKKESLLNVVMAVGAVCLLGLVSSCEWDRANDDATWNDSYNSKYEWVNFSGVYQHTSGWYVVSQFRRPSSGGSSSSSGGGGGSTVAGAHTLTIDTGDNSRSAFGTTLPNTPIMPGTFSVSASIGPGVQTFYDQNRDGALVSTPSAWTGGGYINYYSGSLSVEFQTPPTNGAPIIVTYVTGVGGNTNVIVTTTTDRPRPGSSQPIYQFSIFQDGYQLTLRDNYGNEYYGRIVTVYSTAGGVDTDIRPGEAVTIIASFEASGEDAQGREVELSGTLEGTYTAAPEDTTTITPGATTQNQQETPTYRGTLEDRVIRGLWVEEDTGLTGEIEGVATEPVIISGGSN